MHLTNKRNIHRCITTQQCLQQCNSGIGGNRGSQWPVTRGNRGRSRLDDDWMGDDWMAFTRNYGPGDSDSRQLTESATEKRLEPERLEPGPGKESGT